MSIDQILNIVDVVGLPGVLGVAIAYVLINSRISFEYPRAEDKSTESESQAPP